MKTMAKTGMKKLIDQSNLFKFIKFFVSYCLLGEIKSFNKLGNTLFDLFESWSLGVVP